MTEETIFGEAIAKRSRERAEYLDAACRDDAGLRARIESLIAAHESAGSFLDVPAVEQTCGMITERAGHVIGRYKLLEQIGEGGMGVVYMAEQEHPVRRRVALKIIKPGMDSRQVIARFESERQALAMMDHPNIARVLDAGTTDAGRPYFVMELVMGVPITEFCDENELTTRQRLELLIPACHAVQHAHQKGIIHRDLKPGNVLVVLYDGVAVPKVIDFGVAKATSASLTERTLFTGFGQIVGTLEYMSPEQAELSGIDVDTRSDVYALGVLMYELLTGTTPLDHGRMKSSSFDDLMRRIREEEPDRPSQRLSRSREALGKISAQRRMEPANLTRSLRGELDWIVLKALEKDRSRRYQTANGLARDIQRYLADETVEACPPSRSYRLRKFARKNRGLLVGAMAFAALLVCAVVVSTLLTIRAIDAERDQAKLRDTAEKKEREARTAATRSDQVAQVLTRMLHAAGPHTAQGKDTTLLRQMLDQTAQQLDAELKDHPEVEADLRYTIAFTYWDVGDEAKCEANLRRAMEKYRAALGPEHAKTALATANLGACMTRRGRQSEGGPLAAEGLEIARRAGNAEVLAECLHARAESLGGDMLVIEAEPYLREAIAIWEKLGHRVPLARDKAALATCLSAHGRYSDAEPIQREVLAFDREQFGAHPRTVMSLHALAYCLGRQDKLGEARPLAVEAYNLGRKLNSADHPTVAMTMRNLLDVLIRMKEWDAAETMLDRLINELPENWEFRVARGNLFARRVGEWSSAIDDLSAAARMNPENDSVAMHLGVALLYSGRENASREHMRAALARFANAKEIPVADKIAKLALLHNPGGADLEAACRLADLSARTTEPSWLVPWTQLCGSLAAYRRDRFSDAVQLAWRSHAHPAAATHGKAAAYFIEAMGQARLVKAPEARAAWKRGEELMGRGQIRESGDFGVEWPDWLAADLLGREAGALIK